MRRRRNHFMVGVWVALGSLAVSAAVGVLLCAGGLLLRPSNNARCMVCGYEFFMEHRRGITEYTSITECPYCGLHLTPRQFHEEYTANKGKPPPKAEDFR